MFNKGSVSFCHILLLCASHNAAKKIQTIEKEKKGSQKGFDVVVIRITSE